MLFAPEALHDREAVLDVDHGVDVPSPQSNEYSTAWPLLQNDPDVVYVSDLLGIVVALPEGVPGIRTISRSYTKRKPTLKSLCSGTALPRNAQRVLSASLLHPPPLKAR